MKLNCVRLLGLLAAASLTAGLCLGEQRAQVAAKQAIVTSMYGNVQVRHGTAGWSAAELNEVLRPQDAIKTGADSRAEVSIGRGGYVRMDENSHLLITQLQEGGQSSIKALIGGVWVTITKALTGGSFQVEMPSAVAAVRGTVFRCLVSDDGSSETYVYEGTVDVTAGQERAKVEAAHFVRAARGRKLALTKMNLEQEDAKPWVLYNRHRDLLPKLGDPRIIVALTEEGLTDEKGAFVASQTLAQVLRRLGFTGASVSAADAPGLSVGANGWMQWRRAPDAAYCVLGKVSSVVAQRPSNGKFISRAQGTAVLVPAGQRKPLAEASGDVGGVGGTEREALANALRALGARLGEELGARIMETALAQKPDAIRIDFIGVSDRDDVEAVHRIIQGISGMARVSPFRTLDGHPAIAVVGDVQPGSLAQGIRNRAGRLSLDVRVVGRSIQVKFKAMSRPPGPGGRPQIGPPRKPIQRPPKPRHPAKPRGGQP